MVAFRANGSLGKEVLACEKSRDWWRTRVGVVIRQGVDVCGARDL